MALKISLKSAQAGLYALSLGALTLPALTHAQPIPTAPDQTAYTTPFERDTLSTATYAEAVAYYEVLAKAYPNRIRVDSIGPSDTDLPLLLVTIADGVRSVEPFNDRRPTLLINNGIHAGEPCGVDASLLLARDLVMGRLSSLDLNGVRVAIVPAYNIGGMLNRGGMTRANQNGPRSYGFRGNAQNLDLNRDFVKRDSPNARTLTALMRQLSPDVFIDTHTTNGADYPYAITVIATQYDKLGPVLGPYLRNVMEPALYRAVEADGHLVVPYVNADGPPQENGIDIFIEGPRYSTGYAALLHTLSFVTEAHMLKPFATRVRATQSFLEASIEFWLTHRVEIGELRVRNAEAMFGQDSTALRWVVDTTRADTLDFRAYAAVREPSAVTGAERLRYDQTQPLRARVPFRSYARPAAQTTRPRYYYVPAVYADLVVSHSATDVRRLTRDSSIAGVAFRIDDYATLPRPYEGHYLHYGVTTTRVPRAINARAGDLLVEVTPANWQLLAATLEPEAVDSYFAWGFFDSWLQQKEHFSDYVFEETAAEMLQASPRLRAEFEAKRTAEEAFRQNPRAQLDWLYQRSDHFEGDGGYGVLPVVRVE